MPRSLQELVLGGRGRIAAELGGFVLGVQVFERSGSLSAWAAAGVVMLGAAELVRRHTRRRWPAQAFQAGVLILYVLGAAVVARAYLQS